MPAGNQSVGKNPDSNSPYIHFSTCRTARKFSTVLLAPGSPHRAKSAACRAANRLCQSVGFIGASSDGYRFMQPFVTFLLALCSKPLAKADAAKAARSFLVICQRQNQSVGKNPDSNSPLIRFSAFLSAGRFVILFLALHPPTLCSAHFIFPETRMVQPGIISGKKKKRKEVRRHESTGNCQLFR